MRRALLYGLVVVCVFVLFSLSGPSAQRIALPEASVSRPAQVEVTNFPAVQQVAGTVNVGNLPVDVDGNIRVSNATAVPPSPRHLVGVTQGTFVLDQGLFPLARACHQDFPGSRPCTTGEIVATVNPPTLSPGQAWVLPVQAFSSSGPDNNPRSVDIPTGIANVGDSLACNGFISAGTNAIAVDQDGRFARVSCELILPVACCGY